MLRLRVQGFQAAMVRYWGIRKLINYLIMNCAIIWNIIPDVRVYLRV